MLSTEVSHFLTKELPRELKVTHKNTRIYSRRVNGRHLQANYRISHKSLTNT
jgi:hypothetical protein